MGTDSLAEDIRRNLSERDIRNNSTLQSFDNIKPHLRILADHATSVNSILDVGCGRGGFAAVVGDLFDAEEVYGIDTSEKRRKQAESNGVTTFDVDMDSEPLPFENGSIDLVISFGLLEHLRFYTHFFTESQRVLADGWLWISAPNLASWINRLALLFGYQPRVVEISTDQAVGTLPWYRKKYKFYNQNSAPTYTALIELLNYHEFSPVRTVGLSPYQNRRVIKYVDKLISHRTSLARRIAILSRATD